MGTYREMYDESIRRPAQFWGEQAKKIAWFEEPKMILSQDARGFYRWFHGGKLNTCYLALDHHVKTGRGDQLALVYDSPVTNTKETYTYSELLDRVARFAGGLRRLGLEKGDTAVLYMPMIPEAVIAMLACARLGVVHSVVFGGFAPHELAIRIDDAKPKAMISATCGIEFKNLLPYKPLLDEAIELATHKPPHVVVKERPMLECEKVPGRDHYWREVEDADPVDAVELDATDPLYVLYTSGTTGKPKGIVRDNGGHAVAMKFSMDVVYDTHAGEVFWAGSDVGWVVGHSYIVYGPLIQGCTSILYEGKPIRTPDAGSFWRVIAEHRVKTFFTAPTAFRAIKKEDPEIILRDPHDISCLKYLFLAGERLDPPTYRWLNRIMDVPVIDHWWQTETGWAIAGNPAGLELFETKVGSATMPIPGYDVRILDPDGRELPPDEQGNVAIRLPMPPGCLPTLWNDDDRFESSYLSDYEGYYLTGDGGYKDDDGYIFIMGRVDDVINVAGHRLSTGEMEEIIGGHDAVAECAVVGIDDDLKGQVPIGLVVLKDGATIDEHDLEADLVERIRTKIGPIACFRQNVIVKRLPKTRSGKILRKTIREVADKENVIVPSTIDDPKILDEVQESLSRRQIGKALQTEGL
ncbi:MAG: acetate--CoA ligase [Candidatus Eisenbacteria bacterium]|uniref:Acetate--CoA ligase n=1 Tax=Eiseniibacteriota bacterium TaxID=2212470 RepID=A0A956NGN3_UNCEI|nr:acetate--CoA ligase [Candidatus Eisenbacteria bacterium]MCB9466446.1 acetate--CoA ligase [Candidatus Eisenbacteria bacterium]